MKVNHQSIKRKINETTTTTNSLMKYEVMWVSNMENERLESSNKIIREKLKKKKKQKKDKQKAHESIKAAAKNKNKKQKK